VAVQLAASQEDLSSMKLVKEEEVSGEWRKVRNEEHHCVYCLPQINKRKILLKAKLSLCLVNCSLRHEDVWGSAGIAPLFLTFGTKWR
jgi:hypothetical protein